MTTDANDKPARPLLGGTAQARAAEREARRAAALRANLQRRKEQGRVRRDDARNPSPSGTATDREPG